MNIIFNLITLIILSVLFVLAGKKAINERSSCTEEKIYIKLGIYILLSIFVTLLILFDNLINLI
jgi:cell division protein FtsW (lipid II flippase)